MSKDEWKKLGFLLLGLVVFEILGKPVLAWIQNKFNKKT